MTIGIVPLIICVLGLLTYGFSKNDRTCELGRLSFIAGLLITLYVYANHTVSL